MSKIIFPGYFKNINSIDIIIKNDGEYMMKYDDIEKKWYFELDDKMNKKHKMFYYMFLVNKQFLVNNIDCKYNAMATYKFESIFDFNSTIVYETPLLNEVSTFKINGNIVSRTSSFRVNDGLINVALHFSNTTSCLLLLEWLNPEGKTVELKDFFIQTEEIVLYSLVSQMDKHSFGKWTINVYINGKKIDTIYFILLNTDKLSGYTQNNFLDIKI